MLENFIYSKQKSLFEDKLNNGEVLDEAIAFIEDTKEIWNHGTYFDCSTTDLTQYDEIEVLEIDDSVEDSDVAAGTFVRISSAIDNNKLIIAKYANGRINQLVLLHTSENVLVFTGNPNILTVLDGAYSKYVCQEVVQLSSSDHIRYSKEDIRIPTTTSQLDNDSDFTTASALNTVNTELTNKIDSEINRAQLSELTLDAKITDHTDITNSALNLKADKSDTYTKAQVDLKVASSYKVKGSSTFEGLPTSNNSVGDTYNITNSFTLNSVLYPAGTNIVYTEDGWDALSGVFDTTALEGSIQDVADDLTEEVVRAKTKESELTNSLNAINANYVTTDTEQTISGKKTFTDGTIEKANKLSTPRLIWGKSFDGTGDVNGGIHFLNNDGVLTNTIDINTYKQLTIGYTNATQGYDTVISGKNIFFKTGLTPVDRVIIAEGGHVGIGTTSPAYKLDVNGTLGVTGVATLGGSSTAIWGTLTVDGATTLSSSLTVTGTTLLCTNEGDRVGIRTNSPEEALDVNSNSLVRGNAYFNSNIYKYNPDKTYRLCLAHNVNTSNPIAHIYNITMDGNTYGDLRLGWTDGTSLTVAANRNIGIGTATPEKKLHVVGDALISGAITSGDYVDWYGVSWSENSSDPTCTRIGNMAMHRSLPIQSAMKGYYIEIAISDFSETLIPLKEDWSGTKWTNQSNATSVIGDTWSGNVLVKIPEFWYIDEYEPSTKTHNLKISQTAKAGWCHHKEAYVGAYEGFNDGNYYRSIKGKIPTVTITRETLRTKARANGYDGESKWNMYTYEEHRAICHLFLVEYATRNSQAPVNTALTTDGFKQGGLGSGCTTGTVIINGTATYSFIPTGTTDSLGNGSGLVAYTVTQTDSSGTTTGTTTRYANRYRGIENPFGHVWKHCDDIINIYSATSKLKTVYKCEKPSQFATNKNVSYKPLCSFPGVLQGSKKEIKASIGCDFFPASVGTSVSTHWCDYCWDNDDTSEHCLLLGGSSDNGGGAGLFYFILNSGVGTSSVGLGSRLTYLPWAE